MGALVIALLGVASAQASQWVSLGPDERLRYTSDDRGNRIMGLFRLLVSIHYTTAQRIASAIRRAGSAFAPFELVACRGGRRAGVRDDT
jgi:hypothetical protein